MTAETAVHLRSRDDVVLEVRDLTIGYDTKFGRIRAVNDVSFDVAEGETLGLIGESGCGKSSTGRAVAALPPPQIGEVRLRGVEISKLSAAEMRSSRHRIQLIFQHPAASLNPRESVRTAIERALAVQRRVQRADRSRLADEMLARVGLAPEIFGDRRPWELSGGQCQRVAIARALIVGPDVLVCDEAVSALDVSIQAQVLNLLRRLKDETGHAMVFISHDLAAVKNISDRVAVMYLGTLCEIATSDDLVAGPAHPYTALLVASVPGEDIDLEGEYGDEAPNALRLPPGCVFHRRCPRVTDVCRSQRPEMTEVRADHFVACHHPLTAATG